MIRAFYRRITTFFSKPELWYHGLMMPLLFPLGNYYFVGMRYFTEWRVFALGSAVVFGLYATSVVVLTIVVRWVIARFPDVRQTLFRTLFTLILVGALTSILAVFDVFVYNLFPILGTPFAWEAIRPILILGLLFDSFLCLALTAFYTYSQWHKDQTENEQLRQAVFQNQLDALKMQINPHFLFNSLTSLSSLIGEDSRLAEQFVDQLSKVYRYLLQANAHELVTLQTELDFLTNYTALLNTRYGKSLRVERNIEPAFTGHSLPPLSLQLLLDNAIKHNIMLPNRPLSVLIQTTPEGHLHVQNNVQRKVIKVENRPLSLNSLITKYHALGTSEVKVIETDDYFRVILPLVTLASSGV